MEVSGLILHFLLGKNKVLQIIALSLFCKQYYTACWEAYVQHSAEYY